MTPVAVQAGSGRRAPALTVRPSRDEAVDALMLLALTAIGLAGFRDAYGGHAYLVAGLAGAVLGVALGHVGHRVRLPLLAVTAVGILAFLLLGGLVSQPGAAAGIPSLATLHAVANAAISGWQELLTTARPVGSAAHLLVLPYLLGLASGLGGHALARRTARVLLPAAAPATVAALSILFGADHATAAVLQGAGFAGLALAWATLRQQRGSDQRVTIGRQRPWQRMGAGAAVLAVAVAGSTVLGPRLPGADAHQRVVLQTVPPFDVSAYPSPLASFRDYTTDASASVKLYGKQLLSTKGLARGTLVRIAAMDSYDGLTWGVANAQAGTSSFAGFQRIGAALPGADAGGGPTHAATITIESAYNQPWLPDLPGVTGFAFTGATGSAVASALRFNVATGTGIVPGVALAGLSYTVRAADVATPTMAQLENATPYGSPSPGIMMPPEIVTFADQHAGVGSPMARVLMLAAFLKTNGRYSDGGGGQTSITAGHSLGRLTTFLQSSQIVGDDEQYAAAMALLANAVGVPARVSLDGTVQANGGVYGQDVRADVELELAQYGWVTLPASQFTGTRPPTLRQHVTTPPPARAPVVPPQAANAQPAAANNSGTAASHGSPTPRHGGFRIPAIVLVILRDAGLPLLALAGIVAGLIGAKMVRRTRRRTHGPPAARVSGAWREVLDLGRDLGIVPARHGTRREQAADVERHGLASASTIAVAADAVVFGPGDPDDAAADRVWALVEDSRRGATAGLARWRRAWVAVNPASLWAARTRLRRPGSRIRPRPPGGTTRLRPPGALAGGTRR